MKKFVLGCFSLFVVVTLIAVVGFYFLFSGQGERHQRFNDKMMARNEGYLQELVESSGSREPLSEPFWLEGIKSELATVDPQATLQTILTETKEAKTPAFLEQKQLRQNLASQFSQESIEKLLHWEALATSLAAETEERVTWKTHQDSTAFVDWSLLALLDISWDLDAQRWESADQKLRLYWQALYGMDYFSEVIDRSFREKLKEYKGDNASHARFFDAVTRGDLLQARLQEAGFLSDVTQAHFAKLEKRWDSTLALVMGVSVHYNYNSLFEVEKGEGADSKGSGVAKILIATIADFFSPGLEKLQDHFDAYHRGELSKEQLLEKVELLAQEIKEQSSYRYFLGALGLRPLGMEIRHFRSVIFLEPFEY